MQALSKHSGSPAPALLSWNEIPIFYQSWFSICLGDCSWSGDRDLKCRGMELRSEMKSEVVAEGWCHGEVGVAIPELQNDSELGRSVLEKE